MAISKKESGLPVHRVAVVEPGGRVRRGWEACVIGQDVELSTETLEAYCVSAWDPIVFDALVLAGAVEYCDRSKRRPAGGWGRDFRLSVAVHEPARWNKTIVVDALRGALHTVMGDRFELTFEARKRKVRAPQQAQMDFGDNSHVVIPFSDGLDSRAVAGLLGRTLGDKLIHVRLGSKQIDRPTRDGRKLPFTAVPYHVPDDGFPESSCRSRGFKFAMVSGVAAYLSKAQQVIVPESGQGALGPVLVPVMHGQPDYRNHPIFTREMEKFLEALLGYKVRYAFPRLWFTKGQTLRAFVDATGGDGWEKTRSCWQKNRHMSVNGKLRQCGFCAACLLRRLSVHAAGLTESSSTYMFEDPTAATLDGGIARGFKKLGPRQRRYADAGVLHLDHLASFQDQALHAPAVRRHVSQLSEVLEAPSADVERNLRHLLKQHESEWSAFRQSLSDTSFIAQRSAA